jgi:tetratricopeptide (TPR) repeat protein
MRFQKPALLAALALFGACASQQTFTVRVMKPAPLDLGRYRLVAVDRFDGDGSEDLTNELTTALQGARNPLTGRSDFEVLDRREVDRLLDDLRRRRTGASDRETAELLDRWKNADVVIRGRIEEHRVTDEIARHDPVERAKGQPVKEERRVTYVRTARARVAVGLEVVTADKEHPVDRVEFDECVEHSTTALNAEPPPIDHASLLATARQRVVNRYLDRMLPHEETVAVHLQIDGDLPELQTGNGFARTGDWEEAARSYEAGLARAEGDLADARWKALYNLGVAQMYASRFEPARRALKEAYALEQKETILHALQTVTQREGEWQALEQQRRASAVPVR